MTRTWSSSSYSGAVCGQPAGLVMSASGGLLLRAGTQLPLQARAGDILFTGDVLATQNSATVLFCPEKAILSLQAKTELSLRQSSSRSEPARWPRRSR